jgi:DNA-binding MarR family transcriptional regulator
MTTVQSPLRSNRQTHVVGKTADALLSRTQQRVMGLLFAEPERQFFATEVIELAGCGSGTVQRELARLCECGLVQVSTHGRQKHYRINPHAPAFAPLKQLLNTLQSPWLPLQEALSRLPGKLIYAGLKVIEPKHAKSHSTEWRLVLIAEDLKLADVFSSLHPVEKAAQVRIEAQLFTPDEAAQLRLKHPARWQAIVDDETHTLFGNLDAMPS